MKPLDGTNEPSVAVSLITNWANEVVALPAGALDSAAVLPDMLTTFVVDTKMRTPVGMLLNTAFKRVPYSAKPAVALRAVPYPTSGVNMKPDSELKIAPGMFWPVGFVACPEYADALSGATRVLNAVPKFSLYCKTAT